MKTRTLLKIAAFTLIASFAKAGGLDSLVLSTGVVIHENQWITIGKGSSPEGNYLYVKLNQKSLYRGPLIPDYINRTLNEKSELKYKITKIIDRGNEKRGHKFYGKIFINMMSYEIDLENAIKTKEIEL